MIMHVVLLHTGIIIYILYVYIYYVYTATDNIPTFLRLNISARKMWFYDTSCTLYSNRLCYQLTIPGVFSC